MHYLALACDYDGTLAKDGVVRPQTIDALERVGASGRKLILITGRLLEDLQMTFPRLDLFTYVVAENGALLYNPADSTEKLLGEAPLRQFIQALQERGITPLVTGRVIVASLHPHEKTIVDVIAKLGLELQVISRPFQRMRSMGQTIRTTKLTLDLGKHTQGGANTGERAYLEATVQVLDAARAFYLAFFLAHPEKVTERVVYFSEQHQQMRERLISANALLTWAECQTVETKEHPHPLPDWNFSRAFPDFPFVYRRSVIKDV